VAALNWLCHAILGVGLVAPSMTYVPRMGAATEAARLAGLISEPATYSVLTGILALFDDGDMLIGSALLAFSVLFPVAKLVAVRLTLQGSAAGAASPRVLSAVAFFSRYSMVDVFVVALLVVASKTMPGGSRIHLEWGLLAFGAAALLSMRLTSAVHSSLARAR
jgi:paraquat-inducible protein A